MSLAAELRSAGLTVLEDPGWETRGNPWPAGGPVGILHHHTAPPVPYPVTALNGSRDGRIKCNINTKPDGIVVLIAANVANFSAGGGSNVVLSETKKGIAPKANALARGLIDNTVGNRYYFSFENDHAGNGGPIPQVQYDAIITATEVVMEHHGIRVGSVISHAEWTRRKIDPYWNGSTRTVAQIRADLEDTMAISDDDIKRIWAFGMRSTQGGDPIPAELALDRIYRNVEELTIANRTDTLGVSFSPEQIDLIASQIAAEMDDDFAAAMWKYLCERLGTG